MNRYDELKSPYDEDRFLVFKIERDNNFGIRDQSLELGVDNNNTMYMGMDQAMKLWEDLGESLGRDPTMNCECPRHE